MEFLGFFYAFLVIFWLGKMALDKFLDKTEWNYSYFHHLFSSPYPLLLGKSTVLETVIIIKKTYRMI